MVYLFDKLIDMRFNINEILSPTSDVLPDVETSDNLLSEILLPISFHFSFIVALPLLLPLHHGSARLEASSPVSRGCV
jgi:hypothetical protein